jgi:hypothetical protein
MKIVMRGAGLLLSLLLAAALSGCSYDRAPNSAAGGAGGRIALAARSALMLLSSPVQGQDGETCRETEGGYRFDGEDAASLAPPSDVRVADVPGDNGHFLAVSWSPSPSEADSLVEWYRIFRSRSSALTEPVPLNRFASLDSLIAAEAKVTVLVDSVAAGETSYTDFVPLNNVKYYYWVQAVGAARLSITGTVCDTGGNPVSGALVQLFDDTGSMVMETSSDGDGRYAFYGVPQGTYYLVAKRDGYRIFSTTVGVT